MSDSKDQSNKSAKPFIVSEGDLLEHFSSVKAKNKNCLKCGAVDEWNSEAKDRKRTVAAIPVDQIATHEARTHQIYMDCKKCGYVEVYLLGPVIDFLNSKK